MTQDLGFPWISRFSGNSSTGGVLGHSALAPLRPEPLVSGDGEGTWVCPTAFHWPHCFRLTSSPHSGVPAPRLLSTRVRRQHQRLPRVPALPGLPRAPASSIQDLDALPALWLTARGMCHVPSSHPALLRGFQMAEEGSTGVPLLLTGGLEQAMAPENVSASEWGSRSSLGTSSPGRVPGSVRHS